MQNKNIIISKHAIKRARKRLKLGATTIKRMFEKALSENLKVYNAEDNLKVINKSNIRFLYDDCKNEIRLITVTNLANIKEHKENQTVPIYLKGNKTKRTMRIRGQ